MDHGERTFVVKWWNEAWESGLWAAAWSKSMEGLTGEQAAWRAAGAPGAASRSHSIREHVLHMVFWRESWLRRVETGVRPTEEEKARGNWPEAGASGAAESERAWAEARGRLSATQERIGAMLEDSGLSEEHFRALAHFLPHDCYHFGQINMLRGLLGMGAIE